ncbi:hypothetical protein EV195_101117 [Tenacibaculum skagerrakense]|uniref:Uncharacterized protein n=1 Tax=Tenacibaculum skagerrakense TaxID=186571 RepID=A0A4R2P1L6_9FLAO|nr:hypothetical protein [Tenacibaculum skagerrakense]TCP27958.1 hypothetical protein EV195_101117 [Tenacibaculum skagerrakense]
MDYNRIFKKITYNESIYYSEIGYTISFIKRLKFNVLLFMFSVLVFFLSFIKRNRRKNGVIGISWNPLHVKKIKKVNNSIEVLDISNNNLFSFNNLLFLSNVNFFKVFINALKLKDYTKSKHNYNSFFYKIYVIIFLDALKKHTEKVNEIFISGHFDRLTTIVNEVCLLNNIKLNIIQHGSIQIFKNKLIPNKIVLGDIYYSYDFSKPFFETFLNIEKDVSFYKVPTENNLKLYNHDKLPSGKKIIVFGCQDAKPYHNVTIINFLVKKYKDCLIYVIPHPRENMSFYSKKYKSFANVIVSKDKPENIVLFISRFSTLGIEYEERGIKTVFINLDKVNMDFFSSNKYEVFKSLKDFESEVRI